ncbi:MAG TPA: DUF748 domain-containing protein [Methylomirabilota bacterium]|nr:DUF748 domain-containing protein [Methylomirabilota bacterium]
MSPRLRRWLIVLGVILLLGIAFVWSLPEIVKWQALKQIPAITGRQASIEDIDINLFTGRVAIKKFRLAEADPAQTFVDFDRLDLRVIPWSVIFGNVRVAEFRLTAPTVNLVRLSPTEFNFSDILQRLAASKEGAPPPPPEPRAKSRWTIALDHFALVRANISALDRAVTPASEWKIRDLSIEAGNLTTRPSGPVGTLDVRGALNDSPLEFSAQDIDLTPTSFRGKFSIQNFSLLQVRPYLPPLPATLESGVAGMNLAVRLELGQGPGGLAEGLVTGDVTLTSVALAQPGKAATPFLTVPKIGIGLKEVNLVSRVVTLSTIDIEGLDLKAVRDKQQQIDLLELTKKPEGAAGGAPGRGTPPASTPAPAAKTPAGAPATAPGGGEAKPAPDYKITIEKVALKGSATFTDEFISTPPTVLKLAGLTLQVADVTWPAVRPMQLDLAAILPGGGTFGAKGPVAIDPVDVTLALTTYDAPIEPYHAYFPFPASFGGRFSAETRNRVRMVKGQLTALSRGRSWATRLSVKEPGGKDAPLKLERLEVNGIDFSWPKYARVDRILLKQPVGEVDRAADGTINVQKLFTPAPKPGAPAPSSPPAPKEPEKPAPGSGTKKSDNPLETMELFFKEIAIEDGYTRFLDHSTQPAFSSDVSKINLTVKNLSNKASQRASVAMQAVVGGDSTWDLNGEMAGIGAPTYVDMVGELKQFALSTANPYLDSLLAWTIRRGALTAKLAYKVDQDKLDAKNDILVADLKVAPSRPSDEVKKRIGLPLGLIVALIKDGDGNVHVNVPITGTLTDRQFDFSDAIWTAVRNVVVNLLKAPFRAIGGLFTSGDKIEELKVDPLTFAAGSAVLSPEMERQAVRVADFLRRSPYVTLSLTSITTPADEEALKERAVAARLEKFQKEQGIADLPTALRRYYQVTVKDALLPRTVEEQLLLLRRREPVPTAALAQLKRERLEATRNRLANVEGIPAKRLLEAPEGAAAAPGTAAPGTPPSGAPPSGAPASPPGAPPSGAPPSGGASSSSSGGPSASGAPAASAPPSGTAPSGAGSPGAPSPAPSATPPAASATPAPGSAAPPSSGAPAPPASAAGAAPATPGATAAAAPNAGGRIEFSIGAEPD